MGRKAPEPGADLLGALSRPGRMRGRIIVPMKRDPLRARWHPGGTVVFRGWTIYGPDPARQLARLLVQAGEPDGPVQFVDPEGRPVMFVASIARLARPEAPPAAVVPAAVVDLFA